MAAPTPYRWLVFYSPQWTCHSQEEAHMEAGLVAIPFELIRMIAQPSIDLLDEEADPPCTTCYFELWLASSADGFHPPTSRLIVYSDILQDVNHLLQMVQEAKPGSVISMVGDPISTIRLSYPSTKHANRPISCLEVHEGEGGEGGEEGEEGEGGEEGEEGEGGEGGEEGEGEEGEGGEEGKEGGEATAPPSISLDRISSF